MRVLMTLTNSQPRQAVAWCGSFLAHDLSASHRP